MQLRLKKALHLLRVLGVSAVKVTVFLDLDVMDFVLVGEELEYGTVDSDVVSLPQSPSPSYLSLSISRAGYLCSFQKKSNAAVAL